MQDFKLKKRFSDSKVRIDVRVTYKNKELSFAGDIYEKNSYGNFEEVGGGQCYKELLDRFPLSAPLVSLWKRWHLNYLNAGDEVQEAYLRAKQDCGWNRQGYESDCEILKSAGLLEHDGYTYGHDWKFEKVPTPILNEIKRRMA